MDMYINRILYITNTNCDEKTIKDDIFSLSTSFLRKSSRKG